MPMTIFLDENSVSIRFLCNRDRRLAKVIAMIGPISYSTHDDSFSFMVHEIIEQMLSVKAGDKIYGRLEELCGDEVTIEAIDLLTDDQIKSIGTSASKVDYIRSLTNSVKSGVLNLSALSHLDDEQVIKTLTSLRGVGTWTAKMYLIFVLDRQDILPTEDVAFLQAYEWLYKTNDRTKAAVEKKCKKWKPYSSIAARYLYRVLDSGLTKTEFHLFK